jgi:archaellum component FlaC
MTQKDIKTQDSIFITDINVLSANSWNVLKNSSAYMDSIKNNKNMNSGDFEGCKKQTKDLNSSIYLIDKMKKGVKTR